MNCNQVGPPLTTWSSGPEGSSPAAAQTSRPRFLWARAAGNERRRSRRRWQRPSQGEPRRAGPTRRRPRRSAKRPVGAGLASRPPRDLRVRKASTNTAPSLRHRRGAIHRARSGGGRSAAVVGADP
eukprot:65271-Prymnesium_polylepis.1